MTPDDKRIFPLFDAQPDRKLPFQLSAEDVREAMTHARPDNASYLDAMRRFRVAYEQAEKALGGPVYLASVETARAFPYRYALEMVFRLKVSDNPPETVYTGRGFDET